MADPEAAQRGVLKAILDLHADGTFTAVIDDFHSSVLPKYFALNLPTASEPLFGVQPEPGVPIGSYERSSRIRSQRLHQFEDALQAWARRFRLTHDLTETGRALPWVLDFGRRACENRSFTIAPGRHVGKRPPPPSGLPVDWPKPNEKFSEWLVRVRPSLKSWYSLMRKQRQSRSYQDPAKRNPDHYMWFVLNVCGGLAPGKILEDLNLHGSDESTIRKGVKTVCKALGLSRKLGPPKIPKNSTRTS